MTLRVTTVKLEPDIVVLRPAGRPTQDSELDAIDATFHNLLYRGEIKFVFHLAVAEEIDTAGMLLLIHCFFAARHAGGEVRFAAAQTDLLGPFERAGFDILLLFDPTVAAAREHFNGGAQSCG